MTVVATASNPCSRSAASRSTGPVRRTRSTPFALREQYGDDIELFFITGADALAQILGWATADELFALAHFVGVSRPGYEPVDLGGFPDGRGHPGRGPGAGDLVQRLPRPGRGGQAVGYLVPDGVVQYICKRRLYR